MSEDIVRRLGHLCLGSRLKRIGERMQADTQRFIEGARLPVQSAQYPLLAALDLRGPMTVGELVDALGVSQPGVTRNIARLAELGLVETAKIKRDQRQKTVALTKAGHLVMQRSRRELFPYIESAVREICAGLSGPLLQQLGAVEDALAAVPLDRRAAKRMGKRRAA